jgi:hypothetical protein
MCIDWIASTPAYLLADHFNLPASASGTFPKTRTFIAPPDNTGATFVYAL